MVCFEWYVYKLRRSSGVYENPDVNVVAIHFANTKTHNVSVVTTLIVVSMLSRQYGHMKRSTA